MFWCMDCPFATRVYLFFLVVNIELIYLDRGLAYNNSEGLSVSKICKWVGYR